MYCLGAAPECARPPFEVKRHSASESKWIRRGEVRLGRRQTSPQAAFCQFLCTRGATMTSATSSFERESAALAKHISPLGVLFHPQEARSVGGGGGGASGALQPNTITIWFGCCWLVAHNYIARQTKTRKYSRPFALCFPFRLAFVWRSFEMRAPARWRLTGGGHSNGHTHTHKSQHDELANEPVRQRRLATFATWPRG